MWWLIIAVVSMTEVFTFSVPKFDTKEECIVFVQEYAWHLNAYVNKEYDNPNIKINPMICMSSKDWNELNSGEQI